MRKYCESDVVILRKSMIMFRKLYKEIAGVDPLRYLSVKKDVKYIPIGKNNDCN